MVPWLTDQEHCFSTLEKIRHHEVKSRKKYFIIQFFILR